MMRRMRSASCNTLSGAGLRPPLQDIRDLRHDHDPDPHDACGAGHGGRGARGPGPGGAGHVVRAEILEPRKLEARPYMEHTFISKKSEFVDRVYGITGGFLLIGILLGSVFMVAAALIIYYKQISEGYYDREKFIIMLFQLNKHGLTLIRFAAPMNLPRHTKCLVEHTNCA